MDNKDAGVTRFQFQTGAIKSEDGTEAIAVEELVSIPNWCD